MKLDFLSESPSLRKLRRNRGAMIALFIISLYMLLFCWILLMQGISWIGRTTDSFDLRESPVFGALLPEQTLTRVGARNMPGFGLTSKPSERTEQLKFYFDRIDEELLKIENAAPDSGIVEADSLESLALAERGLPEGATAQEIREIHNKAAAVFAQQDEIRGQRSDLLRLSLQMESVEEYEEQLRSAAPESEEAELALEEIWLSLDEIIERVEDYQGTGATATAFEAVDLEVLSEAVNAIDEGEPLDPVYDPDAFAELQNAVQQGLKGIDEAVNAKNVELEPILNEIFPVPSGVSGAVYKFRLLLGTDRQGRSIMLRTLYSAKIAIQVGLITAVLAVLFGSLIGAAAGYFGGMMDHAVIWLYSTFSSIPYLVLLVVLAFMFTGSKLEQTLIPLYFAFCMTFWIGPCRVTRGEALKLRSLDYVQAAQALGASKKRILLKHILPNTAHLMFINFSLLFIGAIKGEVVLTYLGLGLKEGASWGLMISQSKPEVVSGFFWQIGAATFFMFVLVLAFNILTDALQDAFDPKHVG